MKTQDLKKKFNDLPDTIQQVLIEHNEEKCALKEKAAYYEALIRDVTHKENDELAKQIQIDEEHHKVLQEIKRVEQEVAKFHQTSKEIKDREANIKELDTKIEELSKEITAQKAIILEREEARKPIEYEIKVLEEEIAALDAQKQSLDDQVNSYNKKINFITSANSLNEIEMDDDLSKIIDTVFPDLKGELLQMKTDNVQILGDIRKQQANKEKLLEEVNKLDELCNCFSDAELNELKQKISEMENEEISLNQEISIKQDEISKIRNQMTEMEKNSITMSLNIDELNKLHSKHLQESEDRHQKIVNLKESKHQNNLKKLKISESDSTLSSDSNSTGATYSIPSEHSNSEANKNVKATNFVSKTIAPVKISQKKASTLNSGKTQGTSQQFGSLDTLASTSTNVANTQKSNAAINQKANVANTQKSNVAKKSSSYENLYVPNIEAELPMEKNPFDALLDEFKAVSKDSEESLATKYRLKMQNAENLDSSINYSEAGDNWQVGEL